MTGRPVLTPSEGRYVDPAALKCENSHTGHTSYELLE
jgi:hypothetical protein